MLPLVCTCTAQIQPKKPVEQATPKPFCQEQDASSSLSPGVQPGTDTGNRHFCRPAAEPWRGVNLGGWLLLEPGPAKALFSRHADEGAEAICEWDLMKTMNRKGVIDGVNEHRQTYITLEDFQRIRSCGLNAVRLPFGYWTVLGPSAGEPYVGPAVEFIDKAIEWAEECGLQVVLDLHGAPGGESADAPCGRENKESWKWTDWCFDKSLQALDVLAKRYRDRSSVTGIEVCNEPSACVPEKELCRFYADAIATIRQAGMTEDRVTIVLPIFQRPKANFAKALKKFSGGTYKNVAFDFHYYHCFGKHWDDATLAQQLRAVERHTDTLRRHDLPAVVGEWSLALGHTVSKEGRLSAEQVRSLFARLQMKAYSEASHGWFFWNWKDAHGVEWNFQQSFEEGAMSSEPLVLPSWDGRGEDPFEEALDAWSGRPRLRVGDTVALRSYNDQHVSVSKRRGILTCSRTRSDEALFTICSEGHGLATGSPILNGSAIRLRTSTGSFLSVNKETREVMTSCIDDDCEDDDVATFTAHVSNSGPLLHQSTVYFKSAALKSMVHVDPHCRLYAKWDHCGDWQRFVVERRSSPCADLQQSQQAMDLCSGTETPPLRNSGYCSPDTPDKTLAPESPKRSVGKAWASRSRSRSPRSRASSDSTSASSGDAAHTLLQRWDSFQIDTA